MALADPLFLSSSAALSAAPSGQSSTLATVSVAARVERLETLDGFHRVALEGWARAGASRVLFALPGKRILVASIAKDQVDTLEQTGELVDADTGITWNRMRIEGWIPEAVAEPQIDPIWSAAWTLFAERCTACHQRRVPDHYTANQWRSLIKVMGPRTGLPEEEQMLILAFLQHHASDTIVLRPNTRTGAVIAPGR
ncbi:hypothetical protein [Tropicimonas aquimaris]|uniref:Uncharacterized protein n=1 Tax=Tropicimonas aquimaris TaxID=914152 RepID=A0ABW3IRG3_9RHOB